MSRRDYHSIYDKSHVIPLHDRTGYSSNRNVNITITDYYDHQQIKMRDPTDFVFNYTTTVDARVFESMRSEQCLDIVFEEFKTNLVDMLEQVRKQELFLKCDLDGDSAKLVFYAKSKIKAILFLVVQLRATDQKEIFDEMNDTISELQATNKNLTVQIQTQKRQLQEKESEIRQCASDGRELEKRFLNDLHKVSYVFSSKINDCSSKLLAKLLILANRILKLKRDVEIVKSETILKADSSARLLQSMEQLRLESIDTSKLIADLKQENCTFKANNMEKERQIRELKDHIEELCGDMQRLRAERDELETDVKQATLIVAQKTTANEELAKDLVQANQMLVNFNHLFDTKNKDIEELRHAVAKKDELLLEQNLRFQELCHDFETYKTKYNEEIIGKLSQDLYDANKRIQEVEKSNRETCKLNELLTRKLSSGNFQRQH